MCQSTVAEDHPLIGLVLLLDQHSQTLHQIHEISVDVACLLASFSRGVGSIRSLASCQVDNPTSGDDLTHKLLVGAHQIERAHGVGSRRVQIHLCLCDMLLFGSHCDDVHSLL